MFPHRRTITLDMRRSSHFDPDMSGASRLMFAVCQPCRKKSRKGTERNEKSDVLTQNHGEEFRHGKAAYPVTPNVVSNKILIWFKSFSVI
ncbi:hypothetical protein CEXT_376811 [Caerostris extrusa]|uniref:Uncharacterized protein n=1 Tax=Caerostris extrusa TaxID=172846 RepID=A0AAV4MJK5_CAEEX|nr:hypothetical protein CEXT_376811 [Caerostris extrusa]